MNPLTPINIEAVELRRLTMPLVAPLDTAAGSWAERDLILVRVFAEGMEGWGECVAGRSPVYTSEYTAMAEDVMVQHLLPRLFAASVQHAGDVAPALSDVRGHPMAKAAIEAAVFDAQLRANGRSMARHLGATRERVPVGVAIGLKDSAAELLEVASSRVAEGYRRLKLKIRPGWDVEPVQLLRKELGSDIDLQVDANGAYSLDDLDTLRQLDDHGLLLLEQPLPPDQLLDNVALARGLTTPICLDETLESEQACIDALALGATEIINCKPGRIGGYLAAKRLHDHCLATDVPLWCGGMLETGIGRAANLALAALDGFTLPGDISAAARYWEQDLVTEPAVLDPDGTIAVPTGPGSGVEIDLDVVATFTTTVDRVQAPA